MKTIKIPNVEHLYFAEVGEHLSFTPKRLFFVTEFTGKRGGHANKKVEEYVFVIKGSVRFTLEHNGKRESIDMVQDPSIGLFIGSNTWIEIETLEDNSSYVVVANEHYNRDDYIETYEEFLKL